MKRTLSILFFGANAFLAVIWLVGFLAAYFNPTWFWIGGIAAVGLPFVTMVLVLFAFTHAVGRRWVFLGLHLLMVLVVVNRHWSFDRLSRPDAMKGDWTLMTFNTPRHPDNDQAMKAINKLVRSVEPDMIALQESIIWAAKRDPLKIRAHAKFRTVVDSMGYTTITPKDGPPDASWVRWVQPVLSDEPIESQKQLTFDRDIAGWPELDILRTVMEFDGRKFAHYNVHLFTHGPSKPWNGDGDWIRPDRWAQFLSEVRAAFRVRAWQTEQIRRVIDEEVLPVIVSGDFNSTPDNWSYRQLSRSLQDAFRVAGDGWGGTYHSEMPLLRIDFVLLGPEFEAVRARVPVGHETESDHLPLVARFRWREVESAETGVDAGG